jgi:hypothetical protein
MFCCDGNGIPEGSSCTLLQVIGDYIANPVSGKEPSQLQFDIILEVTTLNLTHNTWLLIVALVIMLAVALIFVVPVMQRTIDEAVQASTKHTQRRQD